MPQGWPIELSPEPTPLPPAAQVYKQYFGESNPAIAHILKSMSRTLAATGDGVGAALRGGEAGIAMVTGGGESGMAERSWADH
jgi:hypothetical protein